MKKLINDLWLGEPVLVLALVRAIVVFGVTFIAGFTPEQIAAAYGITEALTAYYNRGAVYSPNTVESLLAKAADDAE